jgi:hypothetical protein
LNHGEALKARFNVEVSRAFSATRYGHEILGRCPRLVMNAAPLALRRRLADYPEANSATRGCLRSQSQQLMIEDSSDKVLHAWIAKSFSRNHFSLAFIVFLR